VKIGDFGISVKLKSSQLNPKGGGY